MYYLIIIVMTIKVLLLALLIAASSCYTEQENVLVLEDADFPNILDEFSHILIEFYAPWCGHCKKLAPVYIQVAKQLKSQGSVVRLAKVDSTVHTKSTAAYGVRGYPTLFFFLNGTKIDYNGQRTQVAMTNWLLKRTRDPVTKIDAEKYAELANTKDVVIVYHGDLSQAANAQILNEFALADDFNTYHFGVNLGKPEGTVEIFRNFDQPETYETLDEGVKNWILKQQRPPVVDFDERTINQMFSSKKLGVVLFNGQDDKQLTQLFLQAAKDYAKTEGSPLIFAEISSKSEHLQNFANYIKINHSATPLLVIDAGNQHKFVLKQRELTRESIATFLQNYEEHKVGITDQVTLEEETPETVQEEEL